MGNENDYNDALKRKRPGVTASASASAFNRSLTPTQRAACEASADRETNDEIARRLAALEAGDPSQHRPSPKPSPLNSVAFFDL